MRIQVIRDFAGRLTGERRIFPGEYALEDPALFGAGQYLLDNGFAVVIGAPEPEPVPEPPHEEDAPVEFKGRTVPTRKPRGK